MFAITSIVCFIASYALAWMLEILRIRVRSTSLIVASTALITVGWVAQTVYIVVHYQAAGELHRGFLASWYEWCLAAAWILAGFCLWLTIVRPASSMGFFLLPLVLGLVGAGWLVIAAPPFATKDSTGVWGLVHGTALLLGTVAVNLGFAAGVMYLYLSHRLKRKLPIDGGVRLPSLEWLGWANRKALAASILFLVVGFVTGLDLNRRATIDGNPLSVQDPTVWTSMILFAWILTVALFLTLYPPARVGRKIAYLTVASFLFLLGVLVLVWFGPSGHARLRQIAHWQLTVAHAAHTLLEVPAGTRGQL